MFITSSARIERSICSGPCLALTRSSTEAFFRTSASAPSETIPARRSIAISPTRVRRAGHPNGLPLFTAAAASAAGSAIPWKRPTAKSVANGTERRCPLPSDVVTSTPSAVGNIWHSSMPATAGFTAYAPSLAVATWFRPWTRGSAATALEPTRHSSTVPASEPSRSMRNTHGPRVHATPAVRWKSVPDFGPDETGKSSFAVASVQPSSSRTSAPITSAPCGTVSTSCGASPASSISGFTTCERSRSSSVSPLAE